MDDPTARLLAAGSRVAIEPSLLGGWDEAEQPTPAQSERATLIAGVLWHAAEMMLEDLLADVGELNAAIYQPDSWANIVGDSRVLSALPGRFHHRITPGHANRFAVVAVDLVGRLSYGWRPCACTAQELMLWILLGTGQGIVGAYEIDLGEWHEEVSESLFEDLDFEALLDDSMDGFEDLQLDNPGGMMNMRFEDWFVPFGAERLPPLAEDASSGQ